MKIFISLSVCLLCLCTPHIQAQGVAPIATSVNTTAPVQDTTSNDPGGFDPGLFLFLVFGIAVIGIGTVIGLVLIGIVAGIVTLLVTTGVLSLSVWAGWHQRSLVKGVRTIFIVSVTTFSTLFWGAVAGIIDKIQHWPNPVGAFIAGGAGGLIVWTFR